MAELALNLQQPIPNDGPDHLPLFPTNTHICHIYHTKTDLLELLVPFFKEGLVRHEFCLWGVGSPLSVAEAKEALGRQIKNIDYYIGINQLEIFDVGLLYGTKAFDALAVRDAFLKKVELSMLKGWEGFRCDGIASGVKPEDWKNYQIYEQEVTRTLPGSVTALCSYNMAELTDAQIAQAANAHLASIVKRSNEWYVIDSSRPKGSNL